MRDSVVPDFYERYYCTRFYRAKKPTIGTRGLRFYRTQYPTNIGTKSPAAMTHSNSYNKNLGLGIGCII
jgi:hypothetical protein